MIDQVERIPPFAEAFREQKHVLDAFYATGRRLLSGVVPVMPLPQELYRFERNFFSSLFLATFAAVGMDTEKRPLYGLVNQCMRAWVTGCDNLLDDEDRSVFPIDLPGEGFRFKAVLTVMTADRVLADRMIRGVAAGEMTERQAVKLQRTSLTCLVASGIQEHAEEHGVSEALPPDMLLQQIHAVKTGRLFEAPLVVPQALGDIGGETVEVARRGLGTFGLGCQIIDDMAEVRRDLTQSRHNYVASVFVHSSSPGSLSELRALLEREDDFASCIAAAVQGAERDARKYLGSGLHLLAEAGLSLTADEMQTITDAMFPLLLEKDIARPDHDALPAYWYRAGRR